MSYFSKPNEQILWSVFQLKVNEVVRGNEFVSNDGNDVFVIARLRTFIKCINIIVNKFNYITQDEYSTPNTFKGQEVYFTVYKPVTTIKRGPPLPTNFFPLYAYCAELVARGSRLCQTAPKLTGPVQLLKYQDSTLTFNVE